MALRFGILAHADLPHVLPSFRIARELLKQGHDVHVLGSDVYTLGQAHSVAWKGQLARFGLQHRQVVHQSRGVEFFEWLIRELRELQLDILILDAVWQGLAFSCAESHAVRQVVVHHAGLPDFRSRDVPPWRFIHPGHSKELCAEARRSVARDQAGGAIRTMLSAIRRQSGGGGAGPSDFDFGCNEFAALPARRAVSFCPTVEFPEERGRVEYLGTLLPRRGDVDWGPIPSELADGSQTLIACVFGTTAFLSPEEREWMAGLARSLAGSFPDCQVLSVIPQDTGSPQLMKDCPKNLRAVPWVPLWELLSERRGPKVLVTTPGVGAFREAVASGTPMVAIPRRLDQLGAAARVEYFKLGTAIVSPELPSPGLVANCVASVLEDAPIQSETERLRQECAAFDTTQPLKAFVDQLAAHFHDPFTATA